MRILTVLLLELLWWMEREGAMTRILQTQSRRNTLLKGILSMKFMSLCIRAVSRI